MRALLACVLLLAAAAASAGALETCQAQKQAAEAVQLCVETAQLHSTNALRKLSAATRAAIRNKTQGGGRPGLLREYRQLEARHVRERNTLCRRQTAALERIACVADMNEAHGAQLSRLAE
ncbi:hypothetical protein [Noviherbaspirillum sedimenti]|uniref:Lysozyme inhibitor LprI N-terminal domain-containing protein n=1 Tax=Noviherbaspirillum sedimenti TaxID=2320865 RepID=A0A3A3G1E6_9BURK|nr:hypothetical protein [Noviherbaspirillum sedimenti]RJG02263.1 hypothetical protein D3878_12325 [Noviherbaspirillum sedimenti]